ncbi:multidrug MFS transporter [Alkalihalobacillus alcalophilus ATCC 27647 = CGMCC 1.3604]|uniref:Multidrug MFS transporter n=1 Tax=Alkalihalobacillus alcalophilus ATCC 27647 = CGMCC 1.3604 TaxID=1218173 RepID=J8TLV3_ALKAL|nr:DHA2 family efflux MFS transporter permease subunit [Alkalihalobacillus alcalophilus]AFV25951.1 multidrug efflux transporter [Alkalihalobacillus alcalophilus ATCC 27647 = CGMCC 1.3604]KGA95562.1 multidrug MFS transporter [Alkalihalobacillus alcalophilus ATCC 27647 = CGMCC 1.3604]MED1563515.1 DHA2 family efflux MFS transporter permease subunit [Alkalihalobacillus alcalophilus]THG91343.1 multidrug MFS transporter [Alkalihalobacillus alcalophilus ATCC 27647 = CGMCC 1.3604]
MNDIHRPTVVALLLAGSFIAILNQTLMITAIPPIIVEMGVTPNSAQWLTTVFMLVNGIMIPVSAFLIERFTTRQLFLTAMSVFAVGTVVAGLSPTFEWLLLGRVIQSMGAGVMLPLMTTVFLLIFPMNKRGSVMGLVGLVISFAPAIGPAFSGWVTGNFSWRYLFFIILPIAIIDIVIAYFVLKNVTEVKKTKVDVLSIVLSSFGFGGLLYGVTSAGNFGWGAPVTLITLAVGVISLVFFILRQLRMKHPMLEFRVFTYSIFPFAVFIGSVTFMGLIGVETLIPLYMQNMREFSALEAGMAMLPGALITGLLAPVVGRIFDKVGARFLVLPGLIIITASTIPFIFLNTETTFAFITIMYSVRMFGLVLIMMPIQTAALNQLPKRLIPHGAAMDGTMRMTAASVGTAVLVTVMTSVESVAENRGNIAQPDIFGVNISFVVVACLALFTLISYFFIRFEQPEHKEQDEGERNQVS